MEGKLYSPEHYHNVEKPLETHLHHGVIKHHTCIKKNFEWSENFIFVNLLVEVLRKEKHIYYLWVDLLMLGDFDFDAKIPPIPILIS